MDMPGWLQVLLWIAGGLGALYVIGPKGVLPIYRFVKQVEKSVPVLADVTDKLSDPDVVSVIVAMARQFQTDSGSSLRDVVNDIKAAGVESVRVTDVLRVNVESARELAAADRILLARVSMLLDLLQGKVDDAAGLAAGVASDLEASHVRAEELRGTNHPSGDAADAAAIRPLGPEDSQNQVPDP